MKNIALTTKRAATLAGLAICLPWQDALKNPGYFTDELSTLWHSYHLKFTTSSGTILKPLKKLQEQENFCFPCMDKLDIPFFNCTWMLRIHPVRFILEPETLFDGAYGLCADLFEYDLLHSSYSMPVNPAHFLPAKILTRAMNSASIINRDDLTLDTLEHSADGRQTFTLCQNQLDIPKEALELLSFDVVHERNDTSLILSSWKDYRDIVDHVFNNAKKDSLRFVYCNLEQKYQKVTYSQVKRAALLLYCLNEKQFWHAKNSEEAEKRRKEAWYHYNNLLFNALDESPSRSVLEVDLRYISELNEHVYASRGARNNTYTIIHGLSDRVSVIYESILCNNSDDKILDDGWTFYETDNPAAIVCRIQKGTNIPHPDDPERWNVAERSDIHIFNDTNSRIFKNIDNIQYDEKSGILILRQPDQLVLISLKGEHAPATKEFTRTQIKDIHLNSNNQIVRFFTPVETQSVNYGTNQHCSATIKRPYAGQHLQAVDFYNTNLLHGDYSGTTFENCDLSQTQLTWDNIKTARFCGYLPMERAKLEPVARAAEAWLAEADGDFAERLKVVHKNGLLPFVILNDHQRDQLSRLQPWCNAELTLLPIADTPFQTLVANPRWLTDALCESLRRVLLHDNTSLKLGAPSENMCGEKCSYPMVKHLLTALNGPEDIRQLISQNHDLCAGKLDCFDSIRFKPEKLKVPEDYDSRATSALCGLSFKSADLSGCDFENINIAHCDFTDARLEGVNFAKTCFITGNVFTRANLRRACFAKADISDLGRDIEWISNSNHNNFEQADMRNCDMTETHLGGCSFKNAVLDGAQFGGLYLVGNVDLQGASLRDCWILGHDKFQRDKLFAKLFLPALPQTSPSPQDQLNRAQMLLWFEDTSAEDKAKTLLPQLSPVSMNDRERRHYIDLLEATGQPDVKLTEAEINACIKQKNTKDIGKYLIKYLRSAEYKDQTSLKEALATAQMKCRQLPEKTRSEIASYIHDKSTKLKNRHIRVQIKTLKEKLLHPEQ